MADEVRVRYAPSPTGYQHIGNIRTALFVWLFARHTGGSFVIRIEDTDRERSEEKYVTQILEDLRWLGIDWDEGPDVGGDYGPYRQSERLETYRKFAGRLLDEGKAYRCYCTPEELDERRRMAMKEGKPPAYDGRCRDLSGAEGAKLEAEGRKSSVRFSVPPGEKVTFNDMILGETTFESDLLGDFVIVKSDGWPTYHFGVVIDDSLMKISHVIRAEGHLSNTPLHVLLMDALRLARPEFAHLPTVLSADGKGKLSKRFGALSMADYRARGYLPEALMNFMALLGWSPGNDREFLSKRELIDSFELANVKKSPARFDTEKLQWMNAKYIRQADVAELTTLAAEALSAAGVDTDGIDADWLSQLVDVYREKLKTMAELPAQAHFFFARDVEYDEKAVKKVLLKNEGAGLEILDEIHKALSDLDDWTEPAMEALLKKIMEEKSVGFGKIAQPIRVALTGSTVSPGIFETLVLLGREKSLTRMSETIGKFAPGSQ